MSKIIDDDLRATFLAIADVLIPEDADMPAASSADVGGPVLDRILSLRDDLKEPFFRGLHAVTGKEPAAAAKVLNTDDPKALATIGLVASAAYYISPKIRQLIGYPGQEKRSFDADATPEYVTNGMLQKVIDRGPIYRPTPK